ncbi:MAG: RNA methyltransferase [Labilithrix sp.]|nr:RNA methyltransferase [Labilithrix sp.]MCW5818092.1 RNA methyltransferase [Labilithrix sp.]
MRRRSYGVVTGDRIVPARIAVAEQHDPERVIALLEGMVLDRRRERLLGVIEQRLASVQVVFDAPHDPHNGAAVVRSCEAFGVQYVNVVERYEGFLLASTVSRGSEKWVDLRRWKKAEDAVTKLRADGYELVGAAADGELAPADLAHVPKLALVLGNERDGIAGDLVAACSRKVRVPMRGFVESLNVSVSAAILLAAATAGRKGDLSEPERRRLYARGLYLSVDRADDVLAPAPPER